MTRLAFREDHSVTSLLNRGMRRLQRLTLPAEFCRSCILVAPKKGLPDRANDRGDERFVVATFGGPINTMHERLWLVEINSNANISRSSVSHPRTAWVVPPSGSMRNATCGSLAASADP